VAAGRLDRAERLLDPAAMQRRTTLVEVARGVYLDAAFEPADAAARLLAQVAEHAGLARAREEEALEGLGLPKREAEQRARRAARGAERDELLALLEELAAWYRDLVVVAAGAEGAVIHFDRLADLRADAGPERLLGAERATERVRETWRGLEELNLNAGLAFEALFVRLRRELAGPVLAQTA